MPLLTDALPAGTGLGAPVVPLAVASKYATHYDFYAAGGWRNVFSIQERDETPVDTAAGLHVDSYGSGRRRVGMVVMVADTPNTPTTWKLYRLIMPSGYLVMNAAAKLAALADNANWQEWIIGAGSGGAGLKLFAYFDTYAAGEFAIYANNIYVSLASGNTQVYPSTPNNTKWFAIVTGNQRETFLQATGQSPTDGMSQKAITDALQQLAFAVIAGTATPYPNYAAAEAANPPGTTYVLTGVHPGITVNKDAHISGGAVVEMVVNYGAGGVNIAPTVRDTRWLGRWVMCCGAAGTSSTLGIESCPQGPDAFFESYGLNGLAGTATTTMRNVRGQNRAAYVPQANVQRGAGNIAYQERDGAKSFIELIDCEFESVNGACVTGYPAADSRITLTAKTILKPNATHQPQEVSVINSGVLIPYNDFFIDNRELYRNGSAVGRLKRIAVVDAITASVAASGPASTPEADANYLETSFRDRRNPAAPADYRCQQETNATTGAMEMYWNRYPIF